MRKIAVITMLVFALFVTCKSQKAHKFVDYSDNPVVLEPGIEGEWDSGAIGSTCILKVDDTFHAYYEAWGRLSHDGGGGDYKSLKIGHATSKDGVKWKKDSNNPVLDAGAEGEFDCHGTWDPAVIYEDGIFKMWYGGRVEMENGNPGVVCDWGYATSGDGSNFQKHGRISYGKGMEDLSVIHNPEDGKYYMFYWNRMIAPWKEIMDGTPSPSGLSVAVSNDETNFDFENAHVITIEGQEWPVKFPHVIRAENKWILVYGEAKVRGEPASSGIAVSEDLLNWKKAIFPIVKGHDAELINMGKNKWNLYYAPLGFFDMPNATLRVAKYKGKLSDLKQ
jgi:predicted GH43/DUF377 family glycosyl hydrolase